MTGESTMPAPDVAAAEPTPRKLDPEALAIRAQPARAIRIKRGAVIALTALGMLFVMFAAWAALRHGGTHKAVVQDQAETPTNGAGDSLNGLARTYADAPKLGQPLPGDLGKPMLDQQQRQLGGQGAEGRQGLGQMIDPARQQREAETKAALQSGLMVTAAGSQQVSSAAASTGVAPAAPASCSRTAR